MGKTPKDRSNQTRTFDPDGFRRRADAIIFRDTTFREVLLVSSRSEPERWTVAGGGVEPNENGMGTSLREAREEAGVVGTVDSLVGSFEDPERKTRTEVYIIIADRMVDSWADQDEMDRQRKWFPLKEAISQTSRRPLKQQYLQAACKLAELRREQLAPPTSPPPPPLPLSLSHRTPLLSLVLTCFFICCVGAYFVLV